MLSSVGRPKVHDERTRAALVAAAEQLVAEGGPDALSVRAVADEVGTSTRAVYSLFGSRDGLVVALAQQAFEILDAGLAEQRETADPVADLVETGLIFRRFVQDHPSLFRIAFQRIVPELRADPALVEARERAFPKLVARVQRLKDAGLLDRKSAREGAVEFNAMCEGLANAELRGQTLRILPPGEEERAWRRALRTVVRGFGEPAAKTRRRG